MATEKSLETILKKPEKERREFLKKGLLWAGIATSIGLGGGFAAIAVRYSYPMIDYNKETTVFKVGKPQDYEVGSVTLIPNIDVFVVRTDKGFYSLSSAISSVCKVKYNKNEEVFECPHGRRFTKDGMNLSGPAPTPLCRYIINLSPEGYLFVDKSRKVSPSTILEY